MTDDEIELLPYNDGHGWMIRKNKDEKLLNLQPQDLYKIVELCLMRLDK